MCDFSCRKSAHGENSAHSANTDPLALSKFPHCPDLNYQCTPAPLTPLTSSLCNLSPVALPVKNVPTPVKALVLAYAATA